MGDRFYISYQSVRNVMLNKQRDFYLKHILCINNLNKQHRQKEETKKTQNAVSFMRKGVFSCIPLLARSVDGCESWQLNCSAIVFNWRQITSDKLPLPSALG